MYVARDGKHTTEHHLHAGDQITMSGLFNKLMAKLFSLFGPRSTSRSRRAREDQTEPSVPRSRRAHEDQTESPRCREHLCSSLVPVSTIRNHTSERFYNAVSHYTIVELQVKRGRAFWACLPEKEQFHLNEAVRLWQDTASCGVSEAMFNLGIMYWHGRGVEKSSALAMRWFRHAGTEPKNCAQAQNNVGYIFEHYKHNNSEATAWYKVASFRGVPEADHNVSVMYQQCRAPSAFEKDIDAAYNGRTGSIHYLDTLSKERVEATAATKFIYQILRTTKYGEPLQSPFPIHREAPAKALKVNRSKFFMSNAKNAAVDKSVGFEEQKPLLALQNKGNGA
mmetsp:Transcript_9318/g.18360  ORF Transcript_9318/g.18360 Transcript_9318/m.18360 type:complete len:337 (-) Transcript_9318:129-1139(-)